MTTGLAVFDTTLQETNRWLKQLMAHMHTDNRQAAYLALRATLHALRDRLGPENATHLGAQLPLLLRGVYYESWHLAGTPTKERRPADFVAHVRAELPPNTTLDANLATRAALAVLWERLDPGEIAKIQRILPDPLQELWPTVARHRTPAATRPSAPPSGAP